MVVRLLVKNHTRDLWESENAPAYCIVAKQGRQVELTDESGKVQQVYIQDIKSVDFIYGLIRHLPGVSAFSHVTKYKVNLSLMEDLNGQLNPHKLPDLKDSDQDTSILGPST